MEFQFREFFRFLYVHRQGLFCEYMAACPGGIQSRWIMKIVGQTDMDAVRMDGLQHFPVVGEKRKFRILRAQSLVNIAYCRKLSRRAAPLWLSREQDQYLPGR